MNSSAINQLAPVGAAMVKAEMVVDAMVGDEMVGDGADAVRMNGEAEALDRIPLPVPANLSRRLNQSARPSPNLPRRWLTIHCRILLKPQKQHRQWTKKRQTRPD